MDKIYRLGEARNLNTEEERKKAEETRTIEFVISSNAKDRHGTRMNMDNWQLDNFNNNPIIGYQHNVYGGGMCDPPNPDDVIGKGSAWIENSNNTKGNEEKKLLIGAVTFETADINPKADKIFKKVLFGSLRAASVGILPIGEGRFGDGNEAPGESNETWYFAGQELLEFSIVNLPSNTEAMKRNMTLQVEQGVEYLKRFVKDNIEKDIDVNELKVSEVMEILDGKTDNYFARVLDAGRNVVKVKLDAKEIIEKIHVMQSDINDILEQEKPDLGIYFKKLELQIKEKEYENNK